MSITIGSLFSGIGGLDLAVEAATGGRVVWQCESDPYARRVLEKHWPGVPIFDDIKALHRPPAVDALCGGFPCQDISIAGKRKGIKDGKESGLWREFARIIREILPRFVFLENVAAITSTGLGIVLGDLARCGFDAEWGCLRACDIGAPHIRNRWFCFAWHAAKDAQGENVADAMRALCAGGDNFADCAGGGLQHRIARILPPSDHRWPPAYRDDDSWAGWRGDGLPMPSVRRGPDGFPGGMDVRGRLKALGNAVVPQQGAEAFRQLIERSRQ